MSKSIKLWIWILVGGIVVLGVAGYVLASRTRLLPAFFRLPAPLPSPTETRDERWRQDLHYLAVQLPRLHIDPFHRTSPAEFERAVQELDARISDLNDHEVALGMIQLVAMLGDAHSRAIPPGSLTVHVFPLRLYWFKDGLGVTGAAPAYREAVGTRLTQINGIDVEAVVERVRGLVAYENEAGLRDDVIRYLLMMEVLQAFDLVPDDAQTVSFTFEDADGTRSTLDVTPAAPDNLGEWVEPDLSAEQLPLHKRRADENYWFEYLDQDKTVYVQYRRCDEMGRQSFGAFVNDLFSFIDTHPVEKLVVDLRHNGGGDSSLIAPFVKRLIAHPLNQNGRLYVIIGRSTFSSAVLNALELRQKTNATLIGDPTSGSASHYGEVSTFILGNSRIRIAYSTKFFSSRIFAGDKKSLSDWLGVFGYASKRYPFDGNDGASVMPDLLIEPTLADEINGRDPVLEAILSGDQEYD